MDGGRGEKTTAYQTPPPPPPPWTMKTNQRKENTKKIKTMVIAPAPAPTTISEKRCTVHGQEATVDEIKGDQQSQRVQAKGLKLNKS